MNTLIAYAIAIAVVLLLLMAFGFLLDWFLGQSRSARSRVDLTVNISITTPNHKQD